MGFVMLLLFNGVNGCFAGMLSGQHFSQCLWVASSHPFWVTQVEHVTLPLLLSTACSCLMLPRVPALPLLNKPLKGSAGAFLGDRPATTHLHLWLQHSLHQRPHRGSVDEPLPPGAPVPRPPAPADTQGSEAGEVRATDRPLSPSGSLPHSAPPLLLFKATSIEVRFTNCWIHPF